MNFRLYAVIYAFMRAKPLTHIRIRVILQEPMVMVKALINVYMFMMRVDGR